MYFSARSTPLVLLTRSFTLCLSRSVFPFPWRWAVHLSAPTILLTLFHNRIFSKESPARFVFLLLMVQATLVLSF